MRYEPDLVSWQIQPVMVMMSKMRLRTKMTIIMMMMMLVMVMMPDIMFSDLQAFHNILGALCKSQKNQESAQVCC